MYNTGERSEPENKLRYKKPFGPRLLPTKHPHKTPPPTNLKGGGGTAPPPLDPRIEMFMTGVLCTVCGVVVYLIIKSKTAGTLVISRRISLRYHLIPKKRKIT